MDTVRFRCHPPSRVFFLQLEGVEVWTGEIGIMTGSPPLPWLRLLLDHETCSLDGKRLARPECFMIVKGFEG